VIHVGTAVALPNMTKIMILADYYSVKEKVHSFFSKIQSIVSFHYLQFPRLSLYILILFPFLWVSQMFCSLALCKSHRK